jgi:hypothetical protein
METGQCEPGSFSTTPPMSGMGGEVVYAPRISDVIALALYACVCVCVHETCVRLWGLYFLSLFVVVVFSSLRLVDWLNGGWYCMGSRWSIDRVCVCVLQGAARFARTKNTLQMGLCGLPNVGKSSLFNLLTKQQVAVSVEHGQAIPCHAAHLETFSSSLSRSLGRGCTLSRSLKHSLLCTSVRVAATHHVGTCACC